MNTRTVFVAQSQSNLCAVNDESTLDDPLVAPPGASYSWGVSTQRFIARHRALFAVALVLVVLTGLGTGLFVSAYLRVLHEGFRDRSIAYVQAFAASAIPWMEHQETDMLRSAARLVLAGSARYVVISDGGEILIDERSPSADPLELTPTPLAAESTTTMVLGSSGSMHLDITIPLDTGEPGGYVRIGIDRATAVGQARSAMGAAAGSALGFDILLLGILGIALRSRRRDGSPTSEAASQAIRAGHLELDHGQKTVRLAGKPVRVTPKQFALLALLISEPGRVFSEAEILEAAWPNSPYADAKDIKQYVYLVRRRLADADPAAKALIETVPGFGYRLAGSVDQELTS